jgi:hypothetical protein
MRNLRCYITRIPVQGAGKCQPNHDIVHMSLCLLAPRKAGLCESVHSDWTGWLAKNPMRFRLDSHSNLCSIINGTLGNKEKALSAKSTARENGGLVTITEGMYPAGGSHDRKSEIHTFSLCDFKASNSSPRISTESTIAPVSSRIVLPIAPRPAPTSRILAESQSTGAGSTTSNDRMGSRGVSKNSVLTCSAGIFGYLFSFDSGVCIVVPLCGMTMVYTESNLRCEPGGKPPE